MDKITAQKLFSLFPSLKSLPPTLKMQLDREAKYVMVSHSEILFNSGTPCQMFPLLLSGSIRVVSMSDQGRELLLYRLQPGNLCVISSSCMLGCSSYPATGISESDLELVMLSSDLFNSLLVYEPFRVLVFSVFGERIRSLMQLVEEVAFQRLDQRLAALLLTKGREIRTTHQQLADELGSIRELVSRLLKRFEDQGIVSLQRERIQILDADALRFIPRSCSNS
jgi:CRP/FNR family transcriptional regulator, anaerobic regulatory protein